ncbi:hypothetical protein Tco_0664693 [Tanacetum coccineum]
MRDEQEFSDDDNNDVEKDDKDGDADDEGYDHVSDTQDADDEDDETESDEDEIYKYKICVRKDEDVEMKDDEVEETDKGEENVTYAAKEEAKKTSKAKDDTKKTELPPSSSSLSVSLGFGKQFLKLSFDSSLVSTVKDTVDADTTNLPPIPEIVTETLVSTTVPSPQVTPIISSVQQTPTPIPTQPITTDAPTITIVIPESDALSVVELRVAKLEKDVSEVKTVDHSSKALVVLQSQHLPELTKKPTPIAEQELEKSPSDILKIKKEQAESQKTHSLPSSLLTRQLLKTLIKDENAMDKGVADIVKGHKRKHDDDEDNDDEFPPDGPNQGNKTKRIRTKESESSKKPSTTKETLKGKAPTKGSKTGKSASAKEPVEEPIAEVVMDDAGDDVARDDYQPQDTSKPKTRKTLNPE